MEELNWIRPGYRYRKPVTCEFCGERVDETYKAIHDSIENINGVPVRCRNNGKMHIHMWRGYLHEKPKDNVRWFVEHPDTHKWWTGYNWTSDPHQAFGCEFEHAADRYARFQKIEKYIITEHMFINNLTASGSSPSSSPRQE